MERRQFLKTLTPVLVGGVLATNSFGLHVIAPEKSEYLSNFFKREPYSESTKIKSVDIRSLDLLIGNDEGSSTKRQNFFYEIWKIPGSSWAESIACIHPGRSSFQPGDKVFIGYRSLSIAINLKEFAGLYVPNVISCQPNGHISKDTYLIDPENTSMY
jgi:hypothetical protein